MTFHSTFHFMYFLTEKRLIEEISFHNLGGMGHSFFIKGPFVNLISDENFKMFKEKFQEFFYDWFYDSSDHPDFHLPPERGVYTFQKAEGGVVTLCLNLEYEWNVKEMDWNEQYIEDYGGTIEDDRVQVEGEWGEIEISIENKFFMDKLTYSLNISK